MNAIVLAGLSARMMVEAAARDGYLPLALDVFGDLDTRSQAAHWQSIGRASELRIDGARFIAALERLAQRGDVIGWVAGSGFEAQPDLLEAGARCLRLLGTPPEDVRRVRNPHCFFGWLDSQGTPHPEVCWQCPPPSSGWLAKRADSAGGWHIRRVDDLAADATDQAQAHGEASSYYQREVAGTPMSALFVGNGTCAQVLGFNQLIVQPVGPHPFVYCGAVGPVYLAAAHASALQRLLDASVAEFGLKGLGSLDFMLERTRLSVLELNPRPSASMALYSSVPLMRSHVLACRQSALPSPQAPGCASLPVQGSEIIYAPGPLRVSAEAAAWLACQRDVHDLPASGAAFVAGNPVCSISAHGGHALQVRERLSRRRDAVLEVLAGALEPSSTKRPGPSRATDAIA